MIQLIPKYVMKEGIIEIQVPRRGIIIKRPAMVPSPDIYLVDNKAYMHPDTLRKIMQWKDTVGIHPGFFCIPREDLGTLCNILGYDTM